MKFSAPSLPSSELYTMRQLGYIFIDDRRTGKQSYVRPIYREHYPRFHVYVSSGSNGGYLFDIHLDQKQASYEGSHMHNAEYDSPLLATEAQRIKQALGTSDSTSSGITRLSL